MPERVQVPFEDVEQEQIIRILKTTMVVLDYENLSPLEKRARILSMEPFSEYEQLVDRIISGDI